MQGQGFDWKQGVVIPQANVQNLMLKHEIVEAVRQGTFHIYQVSSIEEGIEVLTGVPAGEADGSGIFPEGTVFAAVQKKLSAYIKQAFKLKKQFEGIY